MSRVQDLANAELLSHAKRMAKEERRLLADFLEHLGEIDRRKLYAETSSSLFTYLTGELQYSESAAGRRVAAARLGARLPAVLAYLRRGDLHLSAVCCLAPVLTPDNLAQLTAEAAGKSMRQVEEIVVRYAPKPVGRDGMRRLATAAPKPLFTATASEQQQPSAPPAVKSVASQLKPAAPDVYKVSFGAKRRFVEKLERAQALLSHSVPSGGYEEILEKALDALLAKADPLLKPERKAPAPKTTPKAAISSRYIPKAVGRQVARRDGGQCSHTDRATGRRCSERRFLQLDHIVPLASGGSSRDPANLRLLCAAHNQLAARLAFGSRWMAQKVEERRGAKGHSR